MDLDKIAKLAKIQLKEEEFRSLEKELERIIAAFEKISQVSTEGVKPLINPIESKASLRADEVEEFNTEELVELAPDRSGRLYKVPTVIS